MNTTKRSIVVSAILVIALCISLVAGATFALFTSESKVNIAVTSGKVDVTATASDLVLNTTQAAGNLTETTAKLENGNIVLANLVPGDFVTFNITIHNASTIKVWYRTIITYITDDGLFAGLEVTLDGEPYTGATDISSYEVLAVGSADKTIAVKIELPAGVGNQYQGKSCTISYSVYAVQGNADVTAIDEVKHVYNRVDLANALTGRGNHGTISIENDIDMTGWTSIDLTYSSFVLNGNGHSLKNQSAPLATSMGVGTYTIKNVKFQNADISRTGDRNEGYAGALVAEMFANGETSVTLDNCDVIDSTIHGYKYAGGLIGFTSGGTNTEYAISNCDVVNSHISTTDSSVGGLIGHIYATTTMSNCTIDADSSVSCAEERNNDFAKAGALVGTVNGALKLTNCTTAATLGNLHAQDPAANGLVGRVCGTGTVEMGEDIWTTHLVLKNLLNRAKDLDLTLTHNYYLGETGSYYVGNVRREIKNDQALVNGTNANVWKLDGAGHTIYGLTRPLITTVGDITLTIKDLTISGANIKSNCDQANCLGTAAFIGYVDCDYGNVITLEKCKLVDSHVEGTEADVRTAGLIGQVQGSSSTATVQGGTVSIKDCVVDNCTIKSVDGASAIINNTYATTTIDSCKVLGNTSITSTEVRDSTANTAVLVGSVQYSSTTTISNITVADTVSVTRAGTATPLHAWVARVCVDDNGIWGVAIINNITYTHS